MDTRAIEKRRDREEDVKTERESQRRGPTWEQKKKLETRERDSGVEGDFSHSLSVDDDELLWQRQSGWNVNASVPEDAVTARLSPPMGKWDG